VTLLYVGCAEDHTIHTLNLDTQGTLTTKAVTPVPAPDEPAGSLPLALSPDRTRLYAAIRTAPYPLTTFEISPEGALTLLATANLPQTMAYISITSDGTALLGASYHAGLVAAVTLESDGALRRTAAQIIPTPPRAHCVTSAPDGHIHVPCLGGDTILRFAWTAEDGLTQLGETPTRQGAGPRHLTFVGKHAYCLNELDATIDAYNFAPSGALARMQTVATLPPNTEGRIAAADIHVTPDGTLLYASERLTNILAAFSRNPETGHLTPLGTHPSEPTPRSFAIDPTGKFLICAGQTSHHVTAYAITPKTGTLTPTSCLAVGGNPNWIEVL
jgi:6-phosphogluconolactonase